MENLRIWIPPASTYTLDFLCTRVQCHLYSFSFLFLPSSVKILPLMVLRLQTKTNGSRVLAGSEWLHKDHKQLLRLKSNLRGCFCCFYRPSHARQRRGYRFCTWRWERALNSLSTPVFVGDKAAFTSQTGGQRGLRLPLWILSPSDNKNGIVGLWPHQVSSLKSCPDELFLLPEASSLMHQCPLNWALVQNRAGTKIWELKWRT